MSDEPETTETSTSPRGDAAWKAETERVAQRNAEATRAGKQRRAEYEEGRETSRRAAEGREMARFIASRPK
ncbi:MAG: hypothetical protein ACJ76Z_14220 [Thermoleophilaceae bacterium]